MLSLFICGFIITVLKCYLSSPCRNKIGCFNASRDRRVSKTRWSFMISPSLPCLPRRFALVNFFTDSLFGIYDRRIVFRLGWLVFYQLYWRLRNHQLASARVPSCVLHQQCRATVKRFQNRQFLSKEEFLARDNIQSNNNTNQSNRGNKRLANNWVVFGFYINCRNDNIYYFFNFFYYHLSV